MKIAAQAAARRPARIPPHCSEPPCAYEAGHLPAAVGDAERPEAHRRVHAHRRVVRERADQHRSGAPLAGVADAVDDQGAGDPPVAEVGVREQVLDLADAARARPRGQERAIGVVGAGEPEAQVGRLCALGRDHLGGHLLVPEGMHAPGRPAPRGRGASVAGRPTSPRPTPRAGCRSPVHRARPGALPPTGAGARPRTRSRRAAVAPRTPVASTGRCERRGAATRRRSSSARSRTAAISPLVPARTNEAKLTS